MKVSAPPYPAGCHHFIQQQKDRVRVHEHGVGVDVDHRGVPVSQKNKNKRQKNKQAGDRRPATGDRKRRAGRQHRRGDTGGADGMWGGERARAHAMVRERTRVEREAERDPRDPVRTVPLGPEPDLRVVAHWSVLVNTQPWYTVIAHGRSTQSQPIHHTKR